MDWKAIAAKKQAARAAAVARADTTATASTATDTITAEGDLAALRERLVSGAVSVEAVTRAYVAAAVAAHKQTNCLTEILFDEAIQRAKALDARPDLRRLPLFGIPVTLKDQFDVAGHDSSIGYAGRALHPAAADAVLVAILRQQGAVVLAKTNLPQSIMWCETDNNLFGRTVSPFDAAYTPGGSTGGEAALLALHGSMLGWGTDIGGSIRIPAHMNGLYGLKPSSARMPYRGVPVSTDGQEHVPSAVGPLARSLGTLVAATRAVVEAEPWTLDARVAPTPWRQDIFDALVAQTKPLVFGVLRTDGVVHPHPPVARVLDETVARLEAAGHTVVDWDASLHADLVAVMDAYYSADGGEDIRRDIAASGEPMIPHVQKLVDRGPAISVYEYWQLGKKKVQLQNAYLDQWIASGVDAVLLPPMPHTAVPHGGCAWVGYTKVWNVLDYPALVLPGGVVCQDDLKSPWEGDTTNATDTTDMNRKNRQLWSDHGARMAELALPVGVQVVCRRLEEEKLLAIASVIDRVLRSKKSD